MRILDISQPLSASTAEWPGDQPFELSWTLQQAGGDSVNVAAIKMSVHVGTHADGGYHVTADGARAAELPLNKYIGRAIVIDARGRAALDEDVIGDVDFSNIRRVLFRTLEAPNPAVFPAEFPTPTPALARKLVDRGVLLIGTDGPSMDHPTSKTLDSHRILVDGGIAILENLVLSDVEAGVYTLIALPLRLVEADSAPVRAVLIEGPIEDM